MDPAGRLLRLIDGYQVSQALSVAATLGISDLLADGPKDASELAGLTGTDRSALARLLRALVSIDVYTCDETGRFANSALGEQLRTDLPGALGGWAVYVGRDYYRQAWGGLLDSVRGGDNAFRRIHGVSPWELRQRNPDEERIFDAAMTATAGPVLDAVVTSYDFSRFAVVADVGGGVGTLLAAILSRTPHVRGLLFDQPGVIARAAPVLAAAGVAERCGLVGGDFFESVPGGADAYVLKSVLHDWLDADAVAVLRRCHAAMADDGRLLIVEQLVGRGPDPARTAFSDLNMLVSPGGQERTLEEYDALLGQAGFSNAEVMETGTQVAVLEARPIAGHSPGQRPV